MNKWKNFLLIGLALFAFSTVNAFDCNTCTPCESTPCVSTPCECTPCECTPCECPPPPPCCDVPAGPTTSAYNHPANINVCGCWDAFVTGTFLWILPNMEQLEFAETYYGTPPLSITGVGKLHDFKFDWKPAFKVGIGFNFDHDNWDVYLQYTRVNSTMSNKHSLGDNPGEHLINGYMFQSYARDLSETTGKWVLDFNTFDLEFGRPYYNGKCLQFRAHYGLKGGWINNKLHTTGIYLSNPNGGETEKGDFKSKSWLIGPRAGIQTKWTFDDGFRFFGNAAASLFYQKFYEVTTREPFVSDPSLWYSAFNYSPQQLNAALESLIGIGWGTYFSRNNWHFDLAIGYEIQLFLDQNKMAALRDLVVSFNTPHVKAGNLMFHGVNVTMQFDF